MYHHLITLKIKNSVVGNIVQKCIHALKVFRRVAFAAFLFKKGERRIIENFRICKLVGED